MTRLVLIGERHDIEVLKKQAEAAIIVLENFVTDQEARELIR